MSDVVWKGTLTLLEAPSSPSWSTGDRSTCTRIFSGPYSACWAALPTKGDIAVIPVPETNDTVTLTVESARLDRSEGKRGTLTVTYVGVFDDQTLPPDEWDLDRDLLETAIEKHAAYTALFAGETGLNRLKAIEALLKGEDTYFNAGGIEEEASWILDTGDTDYDADVETIYRLRQAGKHVFALFPPSLTRVTYYADYPAVASDPGGYVETPTVPGDLLLPADVQWLRMGDKLSWRDGYWRITSSWKGAPEWETFLYPP